MLASWRRILVAAAMLGGGLVAPSVLEVVAASPAGASPALKVTSTLDGMTTLPSRIRWVATTNPRIVSEVDYLIDGKVIWIEHQWPYVFGGDDNGTNRGYLVTTWLSPGAHRFTVRATAIGGATATKTVTAKVHAPPAPPAALRGAWTRTVTSADLARFPQENGPSPPGQWELVFDNVAAWELDPVGSGRIYQYGVHGTTLNVYAPIQEAPLINNGTGISRYGHVNLGDVDCNASGPFGSYRWSVSAKTLTLTPIHEGCPDREDVWAGQWTLSSPNPPPQ